MCVALGAHTHLSHGIDESRKRGRGIDLKARNKAGVGDRSRSIGGHGVSNASLIQTLNYELHASIVHTVRFDEGSLGSLH